MEKIEYKNIYENEEKHFFYVSTHRLVLGLVKRWKNKRGLKILDAGCGTGGLALKLSMLGKVSAFDASPEAVKFAKKRGVAAKLASIEKIPFPDKTFDLVTCIDVIYHKQVKDDVGALLEIKRVLRPGGVLVLRVPANRYLMSAHDRHVHTARRYGKSELIKKMNSAGLKIKLVSFVHSPIFLVSLARVFLERYFKKADRSSVGENNQLLNQSLLGILNLEAKLIVREVLPPFGQGLVGVATR